MTEPVRSALRGGMLALAPAPMADRYPIVIGTNLTLSYAASAMRMSLAGYRANLVDLLSELGDHEPHAISVLTKRVLTVACGRLSITRAKVKEDHPDYALAEEMRAFIEAQIEQIPHRTESFASLCWALFFGIVAAEIFYKLDGSRVLLDRLEPVHSRRLSFTDAQSWDLYIWDQGMPVMGLRGMMRQGIRLKDYPGKFIVYSPKVRGEYASREGLGRILCTYMLIKRLVVRVSAQDFERFVKPWVIAYLSTGSDGNPRAANDDDAADADAAVAALGTGSLASAVLPDSVRIEVLKAVSELSVSDFLAYLDAAISKLVVGQTFTTEPGKFGSKGTSRIGHDEAMNLNKFDAECFGDTLQNDIVMPLIDANYPGRRDLAPRLSINVEDLPLPSEILANATTAVALNMQVDGDDIAERAGIKTLPNKTQEPRTLRPISPSPADGHEPTPAPTSDKKDEAPNDDQPLKEPPDARTSPDA